jgi:hypothetical protein
MRQFKADPLPAELVDRLMWAATRAAVTAAITKFDQEGRP